MGDSDSVEITSEARSDVSSSQWRCVRCFSPRESKQVKCCADCKNKAARVCVRKSCQYPFLEHEIDDNFASSDTLICKKCEKKMEKEKEREAKLRESAIKNNHRHFSSLPKMPDDVKEALNDHELENAFSSMVSKPGDPQLEQAEENQAEPMGENVSEKVPKIPITEPTISKQPGSVDSNPLKKRGTKKRKMESTLDESHDVSKNPKLGTTTTGSKETLVDQIAVSSVQKVQPVRKAPVQKGEPVPVSDLGKKKKAKKGAEKLLSMDCEPENLSEDLSNSIKFTNSFFDDYWAYRRNNKNSRLTFTVDFTV